MDFNFKYTTLVHAFEFMHMYDTYSENVEKFYESSQTNYDRAYDYYLEITTGTENNY